MHARVSFYQLGSASSRDIAGAFEGAVRAVQEMHGNQGGMLLVDSEHGKAMTITLWDDEKVLRDSDPQADTVRQQAAGDAGLTISGVEVYEVALDFTQEGRR